jgi:hypothetical protein
MIHMGLVTQGYFLDLLCFPIKIDLNLLSKLLEGQDIAYTYRN